MFITLKFMTQKNILRVGFGFLADSWNQILDSCLKIILPGKIKKVNVESNLRGSSQHQATCWPCSATRFHYPGLEYGRPVLHLHKAHLYKLGIGEWHRHLMYKMLGNNMLKITVIKINSLPRKQLL